eukprot:2548857-Amphidinium_carterae.1
MLRINQQTTFDEVHQWISIYFNSTYTGNINEAENEQYDEWKDYNEETEEYYEKYYYEKYSEEDVKYIVGMLNRKGKRKRK